jgi:hypothetical protein
VIGGSALGMSRPQDCSEYHRRGALIQGAHVETTPNEGKVAKEGGRREGNKVLAAVVLHYVAGDLGCMKPESDLCIIISCSEQRFVQLIASQKSQRRV